MVSKVRRQKREGETVKEKTKQDRYKNKERELVRGK